MKVNNGINIALDFDPVKYEQFVPMASVFDEAIHVWLNDKIIALEIKENKNG